MNLLKTIRKQRGLSQRALAKKLGVNHRTVVRWETRSGYMPKPETMKKINRLQ